MSTLKTEKKLQISNVIIMTMLFILLIAITFVPILLSPAFAENTWTVFLSQYDGTSHKELFSPIELPIKKIDNS